MKGRIRHIMGKYQYRPKSIIPIDLNRDIKLKKLLGLRYKEYDLYPYCNKVEKFDRIYVLNYFYKLGYDDIYIEKTWKEVYKERIKNSIIYTKTPIKERKDNQNITTNTRNFGSGGNNYSNVRVPSKKHKNRWKNFIKLFPIYQEKIVS